MERSEEVNELAAALAKAQGAMQPVRKDKTAKIETKSGSSYSYSYADLADVLDAIRQPLSENGLALIQASHVNGGTVEVETVLAHTSGQWVGNTIALPMSNPDPRSLGSLITYGRRYGLAIVGVVTDEDDDGASASRKPEAKHIPQPARQRTTTEAAHDAAAEFASIPSASDKQEPKTENGKGVPAQLGPGVLPAFDAAAAEFVKVYPRYKTKDGKPDRFHLLMAAGKCGWKLIQAEHVEEVFANIAERAEKLDNPQPALVEA